MAVTSKHEKVLLDALDTVVEYVQQGEGPNTAIVKAAREKALSKDYITLLTRAYNTGRTLSQLQEDSVMEKTAEFQLADESEIFDILYPENLKSAKVSSFYLSEPKYKEERVKVSKVISLPPMTDKKPESYPEDETEKAFNKLSNLRFRKQNLEKLRAEKTYAFDKMASVFNSLIQYFRSPYSISPTKIASVCETIYGQEGKVLVDNLIAHDPFITKCAHDKNKLVNYTEKPMTLVADFMQFSEEYRKCKRAFEIEEELLVKERKSEQEKKASSKLNSILDEEFVEVDIKKKEAALLPAMSQGLFITQGLLKGLDQYSDRTQQQVKSEVTGKMDPVSHTRALNNIRAQALLADLLINDEELAGYDPDVVIDAYNDLIQVVPEASNKKLLLQSALKQLLAQGGLDKFDVHELAKTQKTFNQIAEIQAKMPKPETVDPPERGPMGGVFSEAYQSARDANRSYLEDLPEPAEPPKPEPIKLEQSKL